MHLAELKQKSMAELVQMGKDVGIEGGAALRKQELIFALLSAHAAKGEAVFGSGVLECLPDGFGFLRAVDSNYSPGPDDVYVPPSQVRRFNLHTGDTVSGSIRPPKEREAFFALQKIEKVNGEAPEVARDTIHFDNLTPQYPNQKFNLETGQTGFSTRILDMLCPIGMGQRCLVVSPPRAGKTTLLQELANAIAANHPDAEVVMLLVGERPEEVAEMRQRVKCEVVSATFDEPAARAVQVAEMVIEKAKRLVEKKRHVVVLLDSLTRLTRAYNAVASAGGKSSGLDGQALHKAKRFFSSALSVQEGGSLTIVATALIETGARIDELVFEEFRGAGNSEIHLDRRLMVKRIFPSLDIARTATRKDELLLPEWVLKRVWLLRQLLQPLDVVDAMEFLLDKVSHTESNQAFLESMNQ